MRCFRSDKIYGSGINLWTNGYISVYQSAFYLVALSGSKAGSENAGFLCVLVGSRFGQRRGDNKNSECGDKGEQVGKAKRV